MKTLKTFRAYHCLRPMFTFVFAILVLPSLAQAQWHATLGAQSNDKGRQALAFLPNEIWINAGDDITWTSSSDDIHTVTFLITNQTRPPFTFGCAPFPPQGPPGPPVYSPSGVSFDGSTCISAPPLVSGQTFKVVFPKAGNYKLTCLVHEAMTGTIHVLDKDAPLPYTQREYDQQASDQQRDLLSDADMHEGHENDVHSAAGHNNVAVGIGEIVATGGGHQTLSVVRFFNQQTVIHAGETVEWTNLDPITPHTITFGTEPNDPTVPSANLKAAADGALYTTISSTSDSVNSGLILAEGQERIGAPTSPIGATRLRITFTKAGTYPYICALHDNLGMKGTIIVVP